MTALFKQYRITSSNFVTQGETGELDAHLDPKELQELKKLAGLPISEDMGDNGAVGAGLVSGLGIQTPRAQEVGISSPLGSNESIAAKERKQLEREYHAQCGTDLWFIINFSKDSTPNIRKKVEEYLTTHPEYRQKHLPG